MLREDGKEERCVEEYPREEAILSAYRMYARHLLVGRSVVRRCISRSESSKESNVAQEELEVTV